MIGRRVVSLALASRSSARKVNTDVSSVIVLSQLLIGRAPLDGHEWPFKSAFVGPSFSGH